MIFLRASFTESPAYFFAFVEALTRAGTRLGLPSATATLLARQTFFGAARLAESSPLDCQTLRENVTSKGGTTAAALADFTKNKLNQVVESATRAAKKRSEELA